MIFALVAILNSILVRAASHQMRWAWKQVWRNQVRGLLNGFKPGAIVGMMTGILFAVLTHSVLRGLTSGLAYGLLTGLIYGLVNGFMPLLPANDLSRKIRGSGKKTRAIDAIIIGISAWGGFALGDIQAGPYQIITYGFILAICTGLYGLNTRIVNDLGEGFGLEIKPTERVAWSWQKVQSSLIQDMSRSFLIGLFTAVSVTVTMGITSGLLQGNALYGLDYGLVFGLIVGCIITGTSTLTSILNSGRSGGLLDERQLTQPNEGIHRSVRNSFFAGTLFGIIGGILSGLISSLAFGLIGQLAGWFIIGLGFLTIYGLLLIFLFGSAYGGNAVAAHITLRIFLWRKGKIPLNYTDFLDYATERILLRKIGGGYMFLHGQLRDYFATLANEKDWTNNGDSESQTK